MSKLTIDQKKKILDASESNNNRHNLARQFKVSRKTIQNILEPENKRKLLAAIEIGVDPKRCRVQKGPYDELEQALANWAKRLLSATPAISCSGKTLMEPEAVEAENENDEIADLWDEFQEKCDNDGAGLEEYMTVDDLVETAGTLTLTECAESVLDASQESDVEEEIEEDPLPEITPMTRQQALAGFAAFKQYVQENSADSKVHDMVDKLDDFLYQDGKEKEKQKKITDIFK
ncbi:hypothetical protein Ddc_17867 [Ditylenchus destructor]|nr:hypothetical protein Ddc_17867 [Ditylenchus destructor]